MYFDHSHVVMKLFNKIPVSVRYMDEWYGSREIFAHILFQIYGGHLHEEDIIDDVEGLWFNNKNGVELIIYTKNTELEKNIDGMIVHCVAESIFPIETNIIKQTCKELGITQKALAEEMGVSQTTMTNWSKPETDVPQWAIKMLELMKNEMKYKSLNEKLDEIIAIAEELKLK